MERILLVVLIIAGIGYLANNKEVFQKEHSKDDPIIYVESRMKMNVPTREIEFVVIGQTYETEGCKKDLMAEKVAESCTDSDFCVETSIQCKKEMEDRYKTMFNKQPSYTHYAHLQHQTENLQGLLLFWGLTDDESKEACETMTERINADEGEPITAKCI